MKELTVLEYNNKRILTTKQLAEVYETTEDNIRINFNNNKDRFIEGKHYYRLTGEELKQFKNHVKDIYMVDKRTSSLTLWTDRGASRHCKILDTDKAWEQFDNLEETYFKSKQIIQTGNYTLEGSNSYINEIEAVKSEIGLIDIVSNSLNLNDNSKLQLITKSFENHNINTNLLPAYTPSKGILKSATELLKQFNVNMSAIEFNKKLVKHGILKECTRQSTKDKNKTKKFKNLVDTTWGENQVNHKNSKETQPLYYEDKFADLLKKLGI